VRYYRKELKPLVVEGRVDGTEGVDARPEDRLDFGKL